MPEPVIKQFQCQRRTVGREGWSGGKSESQKAKGLLASLAQDFYLLTLCGADEGATELPRKPRAEACRAPQLPEEWKPFLPLSHLKATGPAAESGWLASTSDPDGARRLESSNDPRGAQVCPSRPATLEQKSERGTREKQQPERVNAYDTPRNDASSVGYDF